jgi:hypothetical protein
MRKKSRGIRAISWIENFCVAPSGPERGQRARLTHAQRETVRMIYDHPDGPQHLPVTGSLAAYLALLHVCGPEALQHDFRPNVAPNLFTIWGQRRPRSARRVEARWCRRNLPGIGNKVSYGRLSEPFSRHDARFRD